MKWIVRAVALVVVLFGMSMPAAAGQGERPLKGTVTGVANFLPNADCVPVGLQTESDAAGTVTHLGRVEMSSEHCTPVGTEISGGRMILTAANGDQLFADYAGTCLAVPPELVPGETVFHCETPFEVTGGNGRFDDATGYGHLSARVLLVGMGEPDWPGIWTITGMVRY